MSDLVLVAAALAGALAMLVTARWRSEKRAAEARERARRRRQRRIPLVSANLRGLQRMEGDSVAPDPSERSERAA